MSKEALAVKENAEQIQKCFAELCKRTDSEKPRPSDVSQVDPNTKSKLNI